VIKLLSSCIYIQLNEFIAQLSKNLSNNSFYTAQLKAQVRRSTVEITVLLLTNPINQPNYCIVLTIFI